MYIHWTEFSMMKYMFFSHPVALNLIFNMEDSQACIFTATETCFYRSTSSHCSSDSCGVLITFTLPVLIVDKPLLQYGICSLNAGIRQSQCPLPESILIVKKAQNP